MDNLGSLVGTAVIGITVFVGAVALVIGIVIGGVVGSSGNETQTVKSVNPVKVERTHSVKKASKTHIQFDLSK